MDQDLLILRAKAEEIRHHKELTLAEKYDFGKALEAVLATPAGRPSGQTVATCHPFGKGKTRDKVAAVLRLSPRQWDKLKAVYESPYDDLKQELARHGKVDRVFRDLERRRRIKPAPAARGEPVGGHHSGDEQGCGLVCGDCRRELDNLRAESVHLVLTSPAYYNARPEYQEYESYPCYLACMREVIRKCHRVLADGRFLVLNTSPVLVPRPNRARSSIRLALPFDLHSICSQEGFEFIEDIIWVKPENAVNTRRGQRFAQDRTPLAYKPLPVTEYVIVYRKASDKLIDWSIHNADPKVVEESRIGDDFQRTNVWRLDPVASAAHPAVFPLELAMNVISYYSFKGDLVLDPFAGIGTTGRAAVLLGRRYYLIEQHEDYLREFREWLTEITASAS